MKRINSRSQADENDSLRHSKKQRTGVAICESGTSQRGVLSVGNTTKLEDVSNGLEVP